MKKILLLCAFALLVAVPARADLPPSLDEVTALLKASHADAAASSVIDQFKQFLMQQAAQQQPSKFKEIMQIVNEELDASTEAHMDSFLRGLAVQYQMRFSRDEILKLTEFFTSAEYQKLIDIEPEIAPSVDGLREEWSDKVAADAIPRISERIEALIKADAKKE